MNPYKRYVVPWIIELGCRVQPVREHREQLVPRAKGRVLEIGVGTGLNLPFYDQQQVTELIALDPAEQMHGRARKRAAEAGLEVRMLGLSAESIPLEDDEIDTVVMTFALCTIPDPGAALAEMRRVLKPGGELLFCEHGLAPTDDVRRWQRRLNRVQRPFNGGCNLDRDIPALISAELDIIERDEGYIPGPKISNYIYSGVAS